MTRFSPVTTVSLAVRFAFDQRIWLAVTLNFAAIVASVSPGSTL
jgi:hypothetical protein